MLAALDEQRTVLRVVLVPVRYDYDRSARVPDTSATAVAAYKERMKTLYPIADAEITVNTMASVQEIPLEGPPLLHFAGRTDVVAWGVERVR